MIKLWAVIITLKAFGLIGMARKGGIVWVLYFLDYMNGL
jgi:hypothetical protein